MRLSRVKRKMNNKRRRNLIKLSAIALTLIGVIVGYIYFAQMASASSTNKFLFNSSGVENGSGATINSGTWSNTTTTSANANFLEIKEASDVVGGLGWNFTGWDNYAEATAAKVYKIQLYLGAAVTRATNINSAGDKTFAFKMYNYSNSSYDLVTATPQRINTTAVSNVSFDFPVQADWSSYFNSGNFQIQMVDTADNDTVNSMIRIDYLYVKIWYDNNNPTATWTSPSGNPTTYYTKAASTTLQADGTDNFDAGQTGVNSMKFFYNNGTEQLIGTDNVIDSGDPIAGGSWSYSWSPPEGSYSVYAKAYDGKNNVSSSTATQTIVVDRTNPTANVSSPTAGSLVGGLIPIVGDATDNLTFNNYTVEYKKVGFGTWTTIGTGATAKNNQTLVSWN
ncbi:MAG: Ig-like domain-containing protein, partial [Eubacteriales bacterium]